MTVSDADRRKSPIFLERKSYRLRRVTDAARLLPVLGLLLWSVPLLWAAPPGPAVSSSGALIYIFGVWGLLVIAAFLLSFGLRKGGDGGEGNGE